MVAERIRTASSHVIFVERERRFYVEDLEPDREQLQRWRSLSANGHA
jgi:hypothetical protein